MDDRDRQYRDSRQPPKPRKRTTGDAGRREAPPARRRDDGAARDAQARPTRESRTTAGQPHRSDSQPRSGTQYRDPAERSRSGAGTSGMRNRGTDGTTSGRTQRPSAGTRPRQSADGRRPRQPDGPRPKKRTRARRAWRIVLLVLAGLFAVTAIAGCVVINRLSSTLPDLTGDTILAETSVIYDSAGNVLAELHAEENRTYVPLASIPVDLRNAVISTEDQRFYEHDGVDPLGIARALWVDIFEGGHQGGSTITQQYVVNTFIKREDTLTRKLKEAMLAYKLESKYSKDQILEMYLNTIYFGHGAYGVEAAAQTYFGKSASDLTTAECAMIGGVIKSPGRYSPRIDPDAAKLRRSTVLSQMLSLGYIDQATYDAADAEAFTLAAVEPTDTAAPYFLAWITQQLIDTYGADAVYKGGLHVTTTIDMTMQAAAEAAIASILDEEGDPSTALVAIDPDTGEVRALVGGQDFNTQQFNVATQGLRQPGSSFKTFVLVTALEQGISPEQTYESSAMSLTIPGGQTWKVSGSSSGGLMRLRQATVNSVNSVYAQLILKVTADKVAETANRMGITTEINAVPAIALGSQEVTPLEMASAYGTLANSGTHVDAHGILEVSDADGVVLYSADPTATAAVDPAVAYLVTNILEGVIDSGTGTSADIGRPAAGKTGTTQEYRDAWFVGYTPDLVASVWVGYPDSQVEMTNVHGIKVTGGSFPAKIWAAFMKAALANTAESDFEKPDGLTSATICLESGEIATEYCTKTGTGLFLAGKLPPTCALHAAPVMVKVPNLIGTMKSDAMALLVSLLLNYEITEQPVAGVPAGMVADQDPKYGSEVATGTVISIIVSTGDPEGEEPVAAYTYSPESPAVGELVTFDASGSTDADGQIVTWTWEFDDGTATASGETVTHTFTSAGTYTVTLWVTDDDGLAASLPIEITVQ